MSDVGRKQLSRKISLVSGGVIVVVFRLFINSIPEEK